MKEHEEVMTRGTKDVLYRIWHHPLKDDGLLPTGRAIRAEEASLNENPGCLGVLRPPYSQD